MTPISIRVTRGRYLVDMFELRLYKDVNNGYARICTIIDLYNKHVYAVPCY